MATLSWNADVREWSRSAMTMKQQRRGKSLHDTVAVGLEQASSDSLFIVLQVRWLIGAVQARGT